MHVNESGLGEVLTRTMDSSMAGAAAVLEGAEFQPTEQETDFLRDVALTLVLLVIHPCPQTKIQCLLSHYCIFFYLTIIQKLLLACTSFCHFVI